jgi:hypothetical protein
VRAAAGGYEVSKGGVAVEVEMDCEDDGGDDEDQEEEHQARAQHHRRRGGLPRRRVERRRLGGLHGEQRRRWRRWLVRA